ncbi:hypothetical protein RUM43_011757 [Polyplax serrata]|uniref:Uncharacterized protein n=1 Tax=Polyplax serrata TaxID=468196 RepID=A0AAN8P1I0_POLSC
MSPRSNRSGSRQTAGVEAGGKKKHKEKEIKVGKQGRKLTSSFVENLNGGWVGREPPRHKKNSLEEEDGTMTTTSSSSSDAADAAAAAFDIAQEHEGGLEEKKRRGRLREKLSSLKMISIRWGKEHEKFLTSAGSEKARIF